MKCSPKICYDKCSNVKSKITQIFRDFDADDEGLYVGNIYIEISEEENYKCSVTINISLLGLLQLQLVITLFKVDHR